MTPDSISTSSLFWCSGHIIKCVIYVSERVLPMSPVYTARGGGIRMTYLDFWVEFREGRGVVKSLCCRLTGEVGRRDLILYERHVCTSAAF